MRPERRAWVREFLVRGEVVQVGCGNGGAISIGLEMTMQQTLLRILGLKRDPLRRGSALGKVIGPCPSCYLPIADHRIANLASVRAGGDAERKKAITRCLEEGDWKRAKALGEFQSVRDAWSIVALDCRSQRTVMILEMVFAYELSEPGGLVKSWTPPESLADHLVASDDAKWQSPESKWGQDHRGTPFRILSVQTPHPSTLVQRVPRRPFASLLTPSLLTISLSPPLVPKTLCGCRITATEA